MQTRTNELRLNWTAKYGNGEGASLGQVGTRRSFRLKPVFRLSKPDLKGPGSNRFETGPRRHGTGGSFIPTPPKSCQVQLSPVKGFPTKVTVSRR